MNLLNFENEIKTINISQPIFLKGTNGKAILLIHGYTGSPHDMTFLAHKLNEEGYTVHVPRLPGHGTSNEDFLKSNHRDWIRRVFDSYFDLKGSYDEVYVGGLSMGGVLTLILGSVFNPKKIFSIAGAIYTTRNEISLTPIISLFTKKTKRKDYDVKYEDKGLQYLSNEYWSYDWPLQAKYLYKLMKIARKRLKYIKSDILILASEKDETVPLKAAHYIYDNVSSSRRELKIFKKSGHVMTNDIEKEEVANVIIEWLKK